MVVLDCSGGEGGDIVGSGGHGGQSGNGWMAMVNIIVFGNGG